MRTYAGRISTFILAATTAVFIAGCGDDDGDDLSCDPSKADACNTGFACETVIGGEPMCFPQTNIRGKVFDATNNNPIPGARVVAIDGQTNAAASNVAISDLMGNYSVTVFLPRGASVQTDAGTGNDIKNKSYTLRVSAEKYQDFPSAIRQAIPIDVTRADDPNALPSNVRDVSMLPIMGADPAMLGSIAGSAREGTAAVAGVLVVAEGGGKAVSAVTDSSGGYRILNLPAGTYDVKGYIGGKQFTPALGVMLTAGEDKTPVDLVVDAAAVLSRLTGTINLVNAQTTTMETLIVLAVVSTGEVPPGLAKMTVAKTFDINGIPAGSYDILASYNNDDLVIDPDPSQLPRPIRINLPADAPGGTLAVGSFKITGDVGIMGPGTGVPGEAPVPAAGLMLRWEDDSSEDFYGIEMFDAFGNRIWGSAFSKTTEPTAKAAKNTSSIAYGGPALSPGLIYQWRITSMVCKNNTTPCTEIEAISQSENLRGVFQVAVP